MTIVTESSAVWWHGGKAISLMVLHWMLQNLFPEARMKNSPWWGWEESLIIFPARDIGQHLGAMSWMEGREVPMIFSTVLTTLLSHSQRLCSLPAYHMDMHLVRMLSMVLLLNVVRMGGGRSALLIRRKGRRCCDFLTCATVFTD